MAPGELGDVDQPVDPLEIDERAEIDDVGDLPLDDLARLQPAEDLLADLLALSSSTAPERTTLPRDSARSPCIRGLAHELIEVLDSPDVDQ